MIDGKILRILALTAPSLLGVGLFVDAFVQRGHFVRDVEKRQQVEGQISFLLKSLEEQARQPIGRQAAVPDSATEESVYLTFIRRAASETHVNIVRWSANPRLPANAPPPPGPSAPPSPAMNGVTPLSGGLEVSGSYRDVLAFARRLEGADRLLNLSAVSWDRPDQGAAVHLAATVTRYVLPPAPVAASTTTPATNTPTATTPAPTPTKS